MSRLNLLSPDFTPGKVFITAKAIADIIVLWVRSPSKKTLRFARMILKVKPRFTVVKNKNLINLYNGRSMKIPITDAFRYIWQMLSGFRVSHERALANLRQKDVEPFLGSSQPLRVLDLANGRLRPQYAILKAIGHKVYGIDLVNRPPKKWRDFAYRGARQLYRWRLGLLAKTTADQTLVCSQVSPLPFPANCFDLVTSVAAFEHFLDVPGAVAELHRVLRPAGLAWVLIHLFTSPSGAHNLTLTEVPLRTIPKGVDPWDHLRKRRLPICVPLNEWRRDQYLEVFARHFEILKHYCAIREGEEFLNPEIQAELTQYYPDELTCGAYVIVARKAA